MNDVEPILILPCSTPDFEAGIWSAVIGSERDWTDTEKEYLRRNDGIRKSLMDWAIYNYSDGCWSEANLATNATLPEGVSTVTQLSEWASQYRGELEKQSSTRAAQVESLLTAGDYEAIREWLSLWEAEDKAPNSLYQQYCEARSELRKARYRQRQHQLYGSMLDKITGKASTKSLSRSGADPTHSTAVNESKD